MMTTITGKSQERQQGWDNQRRAWQYKTSAEAMEKIDVNLNTTNYKI